MDASQRKYAIERVGTLLATKTKALKDQFTKPHKTISSKERAELVRSGRVKLKPEVKGIDCYLDIVQAFDFSEYEWGAKLDSKGYEKALKPFTREAQRIKDTLMLGDSMEALEAIEKFAKMCGD